MEETPLNLHLPKSLLAAGRGRTGETRSLESLLEVFAVMRVRVSGAWVRAEADRRQRKGTGQKCLGESQLDSGSVWK